MNSLNLKAGPRKDVMTKIMGVDNSSSFIIEAFRNISHFPVNAGNELNNFSLSPPLTICFYKNMAQEDPTEEKSTINMFFHFRSCLHLHLKQLGFIVLNQVFCL